MHATRKNPHTLTGVNVTSKLLTSKLYKHNKTEITRIDLNKSNVAAPVTLDDELFHKMVPQ